VPPPLSSGERLFGLILVGVGLLLGIPLLLLPFVPTVWLGPRLEVGQGLVLLALIPIGLIFHGVLFLCGIHPKDFYSWWNHLSDLTQNIVIGLGILLGIGLLVCFTFGR
jgi:hypothetical protein